MYKNCKVKPKKPSKGNHGVHLTDVLIGDCATDSALHQPDDPRLVGHLLRKKLMPIEEQTITLGCSKNV